MKYFFTVPLLLILSVLVFAQEGGQSNRSEAVFIEGFGENPKPLLNDEAITNWLDNNFKLQLNLGSSDGLSLSEEVYSINNHNIRSIQQTHQGIPIVGYESRLIMDAQGNQIGILGQHEAFSEIAPSQAEFGQERAVLLTGFSETSLISESPVYFEKDGELRLSWKIEGRNSNNSNNRAINERLYIDAINGDVLARYPLIYSALTREVGDMIKACRDAGITYPLFPEEAWPIELMVEEEEYHRSEGESSEGADHVDFLYDLLGDAYQFIDSVLDMDSVDNNGLRLKAIVGIRYGPEGDHNQCVGDDFNATWHPAYNELYIPDYALPYVEIIAHELAHGIVSNGSGLEYEFESGALNEGIADALGIGFKAWRQAGGSLGQNVPTIPTSNDLWIVDSPIGPLRNMQYPRRVDNNPDHYDVINNYPIENDYGGVHSNSSIINQAFYILVEGGRHPRLGSGPNVQGIGIANASQIFALAGSQLLTPFSDFEAARNAFALAAEILYGEYSDIWVSVHEAMDAVGIPGTWQRSAPVIPPVVTPDPVIPDPITPEPSNPDPVIPDPIIPDTTTSTPEVPDPVVETANNNALYIGLGVAFLVLALFGLSRLRPEYSNTAPEYRPAVATPEPAAELDARVSPQHVSVNRSRISGRLVGLGSSSSIEMDDALLSSKEGLVIGRSANLNHVVLNDSRVSRRHARLHKEGHIVVLEDLNSTHGTTVNGNKLQPFSKTVVNQGDRIDIAGIQFTCDLSA